MTTGPDVRVLSLGAGVQSTALALMAVDGTLPGLDAAIFADTGWEPPRVYEVVDSLERVLAAAGIPLYRVAKAGRSIREESMDPDRSEGRFAFAWVPYYTLSRRPGRPERRGMGQRRCTQNFKLRPIERQVRALLGARSPYYRRVSSGRLAEVWVGFSTDELLRVSDRQRVRYISHRYPLIERHMTRADCAAYLREAGWSHVAKSACIGCPYHGDGQWRQMRDHAPAEWADAVAFDRAIRNGGANPLPAHTTAYVHRSCQPLDVAPIDDDLWAGDPDGCAPYGCRSGAAV